MKAWEDFPEWDQITDEAIKEIVSFDENGEYDACSRKNFASSDAARRAILKLYTYQTPMFGAMNHANQC